jgi:hypothetical protein
MRSGSLELFVRLRWPLTVVALGVLALFAYRFTLRGTGELFDDAGETVRAVGRQIASIGERFRSGTITTTFVSSLPAVRGTGAGHLELATIEVEEILTTTDERRILWDQISLGETTSEIRVPVVYRYHLRLGDPWDIEVRGQTCRVLAPPIRASLPPAIDTERMRKRTESGWLRFDGEERLEALERSLTPTLAAYADDPRHVDLVREPARRTVAEFVRDWLLTEDHWREDRFRAIVVVFPDEIEDGFAVERPTLELELESR